MCWPERGLGLETPVSEQMRALASLAPCMPCAPAQGLVTGTVPPPRSELAGGDGQGQEGQGWCGQNSGSSSGPTPQLGSAERSCEGQGWWAQEGPGRSVGAHWPLGKGLGRGSGALAWPLGPERRDTSQLVACGPCSFRCQPWGRWGAAGQTGPGKPPRAPGTLALLLLVVRVPPRATSAQHICPEDPSSPGPVSPGLC